MIYIDAELENGNTVHNIVHNIEQLDNDIITVEDENGDVIHVADTDTITVRMFKRVELENVSDLFSLYKNKKAYINVYSSEPEATFNVFPYETFKEIVDEDILDLDDLSHIRNYAIGILIGKEKTIKFKELMKLVNNNEE